MKTRMHSSRMRAARSSSRWRGLYQSPPGPDPPGTRHPPGPGTPQTRPPGTRYCPRTKHSPPGSGIPAVDRHTPVNILPCPRLRLRAVMKAIEKRPCSPTSRSAIVQTHAYSLRAGVYHPADIISMSSCEAFLMNLPHTMQSNLLKLISVDRKLQHFTSD